MSEHNAVIVPPPADLDSIRWIHGVPDCPVAEFCRETAERVEPVTHVLGAHIEMTKRPGVLFEPGVTFHPREHSLPLVAEHVFSLETALSSGEDRPQRIVLPDFIVQRFPAR